MFKSTLFTTFFFCISLLICSSAATPPVGPSHPNKPESTVSLLIVLCSCRHVFSRVSTSNPSPPHINLSVALRMFKSVLPQIADPCAKQRLIISIPPVLLLVTKLVCKALLLILDYADTSISAFGFLVCALLLFLLSFAYNPQLVQECFRNVFRNVFRIHHYFYRLPF